MVACLRRVVPFGERAIDRNSCDRDAVPRNTFPRKLPGRFLVEDIIMPDELIDPKLVNVEIGRHGKEWSRNVCLPDPTRNGNEWKEVGS